MGEAIRSFVEAIEKIYRSFVLRDLLGFVLPGMIFLLSLWFLFGTPSQFFNCPSPTDSFSCLTKGEGTVPTGWLVLVFLGVSYLAGWILQCIHHGIVDSIFHVNMQAGKLALLRSIVLCIFWFVIGIRSYARAITESTQNSTPVSLITTGALAPDLALKGARGEKALKRFQESVPYTERLSALMLMTGNTVIAGIPLLFALRPALGRWTWVGVPVLLLMYLEYWRLFYARNRRHEIAVEAASQENGNLSQNDSSEGK